jgi:hypothetical protein
MTRERSPMCDQCNTTTKQSHIFYSNVQNFNHTILKITLTKPAWRMTRKNLQIIVYMKDIGLTQKKNKNKNKKKTKINKKQNETKKNKKKTKQKKKKKKQTSKCNYVKTTFVMDGPNKQTFLSICNVLMNPVRRTNHFTFILQIERKSSIHRKYIREISTTLHSIKNTYSQ